MLMNAELTAQVASLEAERAKDRESIEKLKKGTAGTRTKLEGTLEAARVEARKVGVARAASAWWPPRLVHARGCTRTRHRRARAVHIDCTRARTHALARHNPPTGTGTGTDRSSRKLLQSLRATRGHATCVALFHRSSRELLQPLRATRGGDATCAALPWSRVGAAGWVLARRRCACSREMLTSNSPVNVSVSVSVRVKAYLLILAQTRLELRHGEFAEERL